MAFQDFSPYNGDSAISAIINSPFVGFDIFKKFLTGPDFWSLLKNTLSISIASLIFYFPAPIILALLLNEVKNMAFKRVTQTMVYIPHFISFVIVAALTTQLFSTTDGIVYHFLTMNFWQKMHLILCQILEFVCSDDHRTEHVERNRIWNNHLPGGSLRRGCTTL